jgi:putative transposase
MHFEEDYTYHVYNRSNECVFYSRSNYLFFLNKVRKNILPLANILAYCLMPNHFHFLLNVKKKGAEFINENHRKNTQLLSKEIGNIISSYTQAINKQQNRRGSLFSHKTKAKMLNFRDGDYVKACFFYIHQNPYFAELVDKVEDWEYSSFKDFIGVRNDPMINKELAFEIVNFDKGNLLEQTYILLNEKTIKEIY